MSCAWVLTAVLLVSTLGVGARAAVDSPAAAAETAAPRQYYELRVYHFGTADQQQRYSGFIRDALLPALNRAGSTPVGVFTVENHPEEHTLTMLIPFSSIDAYASLDSHLDNDTAYHAAGAAVLNLPSSDPPYTRIESSLLAAFEGMPRLTLPAQSAAKQGRAFEIRNYESHSEKAGKKKIEMFNRGEIGVFQRAGFQPVFYGEMIIGPNRPGLTYMVTYPAGVDRGSLWAKFGADPVAKKLFAMPEYSDKAIVSRINHVFLVPTDYSQI